MALRGAPGRAGAGWRWSATAAVPAASPPTLVEAAGLARPGVRLRAGRGRLRAALPGSAGANPVDFALGTIEPDAFARALPVVAGVRTRSTPSSPSGQLGYWAARFPSSTSSWPAEVEARGGHGGAARGRPDMPLVVSTVYPDAAPAARAAGRRRARVPRDRLRRRRRSRRWRVVAEARPDWGAGAAACRCRRSPGLRTTGRLARLLAAAGLTFVPGRRVAVTGATRPLAAARGARLPGGPQGARPAAQVGRRRCGAWASATSTRSLAAVGRLMAAPARRPASWSSRWRRSPAASSSSSAAAATRASARWRWSAAAASTPSSFGDTRTALAPLEAGGGATLLGGAPRGAAAARRPRAAARSTSPRRRLRRRPCAGSRPPTRRSPRSRSTRCSCCPHGAVALDARIIVRGASRRRRGETGRRRDA